MRTNARRAKQKTVLHRILEGNLGWLPGAFPKGKDAAKNASSQRALSLLTGTMAASMTEAAKSSWRWRILYLRATIHALSFRVKAGTRVSIATAWCGFCHDTLGPTEKTDEDDGDGGDGGDDDDDDDDCLA